MYKWSRITSDQESQVIKIHKWSRFTSYQYSSDQDSQVIKILKWSRFTSNQDSQKNKIDKWSRFTSNCCSFVIFIHFDFVFFFLFDGTQARNLRTSRSLIAYGAARGVKNWLFSHWVLYRQMGHLWMEETSMDLFSAFKDTLIAYFILSFFPKRHLADQARLHANAYFYEIFEERLNLELVLLRVAEKNSCFLSPLPHIFGAWKGHWNATIFQGDNCHISVLGTRG